MAIEDGAWIMRGLDWGEPSRIQNWEELIGWIDEVGFLPLFKNEVDGFSAEENTSDLCWWSDDPAQAPWKWRQLIARSGRVTYGRFFVGKTGFISRVTDLQMGSYLLIRDFRRRANKKGFPYGWHISVYSTLEALWGYDHGSSAYSVAPAESKALTDEQIWRNFPEATQEELDAVLG